MDRVARNCINSSDQFLGPSTRVHEGDARSLPLDDGSIDLVLTSPPYLNAIDYLRCSKFSLIWMGYSIWELRGVRSVAVGTEVGKNADDDLEIQNVLSRLNLQPKLRARQEAVLVRYIDDMRRVVGEAARVLADSGQAVFVVGENTVRGTFIPNSSREPADLLRGLGLLRDGVLFRAAAVLFGNTERLEFEMPQCLLRVARFRGVDRMVFLDNRQFNGNAFALLASAERFLRDSLPIAERFEPNRFERIDEPLYPPLATRESLANALCHRDYSIGGGSVGVALGLCYQRPPSAKDAGGSERYRAGLIDGSRLGGTVETKDIGSQVVGSTGKSVVEGAMGGAMGALWGRYSVPFAG